MTSRGRSGGGGCKGGGSPSEPLLLIVLTLLVQLGWEWEDTGPGQSSLFSYRVIIVRPRAAVNPHRKRRHVFPGGSRGGPLSEVARLLPNE